MKLLTLPPEHMSGAPKFIPSAYSSSGTPEFIPSAYPSPEAPEFIPRFLVGFVLFDL